MTRAHVVGMLVVISVINAYVENFNTAACLCLVALIVLMEGNEEDGDWS